MNFNTIDTETMKVSKIYDEKELSQLVFDSIQYYREQADHWKRMYLLWRKHGQEQANDELKNEIQSLHERLNMSYGEFSSQKEKDAYKDFERRHMHERLTMKIQGGKCPYLIPTGTGIGTHLEVVCPICGEKENITDTSVW